MPGQRWWRLGPLTEAECWNVQEMVAATGLVPLRGELRMARMGPFRSAVYFVATGEPSRWSLDDGSWTASEARLSPADPPPRRRPASPTAAKARQSQTSLPAASIWAGPAASNPHFSLGVMGPRQQLSGLSHSPRTSSLHSLRLCVPRHPPPASEGAHPAATASPRVSPPWRIDWII